MADGLPPELLAELSYAPEEKPAAFTCAICEREASNQWNYSPRDYERPPICKRCEGEYTTTSYYPRPRHVQSPKAGSLRDRREAMRLYAVADALGTEAARIKWRDQYGRS